MKLFILLFLIFDLHAEIDPKIDAFQVTGFDCQNIDFADGVDYSMAILEARNKAESICYPQKSIFIKELKSNFSRTKDSCRKWTLQYSALFSCEN